MSWDLDDLYRLLHTSHVQAQGVLETIPDPLLVLDGDLTIVDANPAFYETFKTGRDDTIDQPFHHLGDGQWDIDELRYLFEQVIPRTAKVTDYEVTADFPVIGHRTMLLSAHRIPKPDSGRRLLLLKIADATERQRESDRKDVLIGELGHRIKNILAVTQSLARQTKTKDRTAEEFRDDFLGRLDALGKALEVTAKEDKAELPALVHKVLEPYVGEGGPVMLEKGPVVSLTTNQAMSLGMMLHELATNAVKYGALSVSDGRVTIVWTIDDEGNGSSMVKLRWRESNGPKVTPPSADGFGTRLIRFTAEQDLGGRVDQDYQPDGLIVTLTFPHS
jgi:two-component sensor histidine kinase